MAKCYILVSMTNVLQHQQERMLTTYDIMLSLKKMFKAMQALLNAKMAEGTPVQDHVLKMIAHLNELEIFGAEIDQKTQVNTVLP